MAAAARGEDDSGVIAEINVTPLVDVTLVLLIIFMVAAPMIMNMPSIKVELPRAATGDETAKSTLALTLQRQAGGGYALYANGTRTDEPSVRSQVKGLLANDRDLQAIIAADKGIAYGDVVHVVDLVKELGVRRFALDTDASP
jgi:biopolymer transport protein ExbD